MNRIAAALLALLYSLALLGCGGTQTSASTGPATANNTPTVGTGGSAGGNGSSGSGGGSGSSGAGCTAGTADFYVATNGNDNWSGTLDTPNSNKSDGPFATLDRARRAVQGMPGGRHVVMVRGGTYFLSAPLSFSAADSGTSANPIVYEAYGCETPIISGGKQVTGWTQVSGNVWTAKLTGYQNFEGLFYNGHRRYRPRTTVGKYLYNAGPVYTSSSSDSCSALVNGQYECFDRFYFNGTDIASTYHSLALGDVEVLDFEIWTMSRMRLQSVDAGNHIAYLTGPTAQDPVYNGFISGHRYLLENVKEALSLPGQWYLDRCTNAPACTSSTGTWTLTYLAQTGETPSKDQVIVPQQTQLVVASDLENVTFRGITFAHDNWLPASTGLGDNQGIPDVTAALSFAESNNVVLDNCVIAHTGGWGVEFIGAGAVTSTPSNQVINSALYDLGAGGIRIGAWPKQAKDTDASVTQQMLVENNLITAGGRTQPTGIGTGIWLGNAHHNTITHNEVSDFYSGAIGVGFTFGIVNGIGLAHDNVISYNRVYKLGQGVTSDMGGIYLATSATTGNQVLNNVVHDVVHDWQDADGYGGHGIYFDQGTSNVTARNNLVYRTSSASVFNNLPDHSSNAYPQNNLIDNNIFAFGTPHLIQRGGDNPSSFSFTHNIAYFNPAVSQGGHWSCYDVGGTGNPVPCNTRFFFDNNVYWNASGKSLIFQTTTLTGAQNRYAFSDWQGLGEDTHSLNSDPEFTSPGYPADDYSLLTGSPALKIGFVPFDSNQAGRTNMQFQSFSSVPSSMAPAFPLQVMSPSSF